MRALVIDGKDITLQKNHPQPNPDAGEALIRTRKVTVGATDLQVAAGLFGFQGVLGHLFVGEVEKINGDDPRQLTGRRVVGSISSMCGRCDMCLAGLSVHCRSRTLLGMNGRDGCLAEYFTLPAVNLVPVDDSLDDDHAVFTVTLASAVQATRQITVEGKPYITVVGEDALGLLTVQVMAQLNASVRLLGWNSGKISLCEKWGIKHRLVEDVGRRADQDIVVVCTGDSDALKLATELVRPRGVVVVKSMNLPDQVGIDPTHLVLNEIQVLGSYGGPMTEGVARLARREVDVVSLISRRMSLNDGPDILATAAQENVIRVLVEM